MDKMVNVPFVNNCVVEYCPCNPSQGCRHRVSERDIGPEDPNGHIEGIDETIYISLHGSAILAISEKKI
jgi:hypothetical protein